MNKPIVPQILRGKVSLFLELYQHRQAAQQYTNRLSNTLSELKRAQTQLRLQSSALQAAADAVMITDNQGNIPLGLAGNAFRDRCFGWIETG